MANIKFNHKSIDKIIQLDTGIICVHYKDDTDIQYIVVVPSSMQREYHT